MKIAVLNNMAPFVRGGAEELASNLVRQLELRGHAVELIRLPFSVHPPEVVPTQIAMAWNLRLENADKVIALKFPAYLVDHPDKTVWLLHQLRQAYDLFDAGLSNLGLDPTGEYVRKLVTAADIRALGAVRKLFVNSSVTRDRLRKYNGIDSTVLLPPLNDASHYGNGEDRGYIFAGGRVNSDKRQHLLVEAMRAAATSVRLVVAGPPDSEADAEALHVLVEKHGLRDRVHLDLRFLPRDEYAEYLNNAAAVAYLPFEEDSLGYVTMEAAAAGKPVITTTDSGGILQLVSHHVTGWVAEPNPESLAAALTSADGDARRRAAMGREMRSSWNAMDATWDATIERLLS